MITEPIAPARELSGRAPGGMWWVAWRQHRWAVLGSVGAAALLAVAYLVFGLTFRSALAAADLSPDVCPEQPGGSDDCPISWAAANGYAAVYGLLRLPMLFLPVLVGVLVGASVVGVDRERGTQVFALTQSVGRTRWYLTKCLVAGGPPLLALLGVGLLAQWAGDAGALLYSRMAIPDFQTAGVVPAAFALLAFGLAVPAGAFLRSSIAAVALSATVAALLVVGVGYAFYTDLVPHDRVVYSATDRDGWVPPADGSLTLRDGFLDAAGNDAAGQRLPCTLYGPGVLAGTDNAEFEALWQGCLDRAGIVAQYTDYLDASRRPQLTLVVGGICAALAAAGVALGWVRVRRRVL